MVTWASENALILAYQQAHHRINHQWQRKAICTSTLPFPPSYSLALSHSHPSTGLFFKSYAHLILLKESPSSPSYSVFHMIILPRIQEFNQYNPWISFTIKTLKQQYPSFLFDHKLGEGSSNYLLITIHSVCLMPWSTVGNFNEIRHIHWMTYMVMPLHKNPCSGS